MHEKFTIKAATINDINIILELINDIAIYEELSKEVINTLEKIKTYLFGDQKFAECFIAFENDVPVGFSLFFHNYSTFVGKPGIYLEDLFVKEPYRGKGYGKALLINLIKIAKERNCGRVEWSVLNWNQSAIDFYEKLGAEPMNGWTVYRLNEEKIELLSK